MSGPKVSVVIGSYNCEKFIHETVQSVIDQTFRDWELIIVDDCSTDNTCQEISRIKDERIKLIRLDSNSGLPAAPRNVGIKNAKGDYIAFLDHDDIWLPEKLERQVAFLEKNKDIIAVGKNVLHAKVLVMGITFKEDVSDLRNSRVADVVTELVSYGVKVDVIDPPSEPLGLLVLPGMFIPRLFFIKDLFVRCS